LEYETHRGALANNHLWHPFYTAGLLDNKTDAAVKKEMSLRMLGYVPVSADRSKDRYVPRTDELVNDRHGSLRRPILKDGVEPDSALGRLLEQFKVIRADMRFREDGLHAIVRLIRD